MRVVVIYKRETDYGRQVEDYLADFERQTGRALEAMNPESLEGISFCSAYDIMQYPTVVAISDGGQLQNIWKGLPLPTINEVSFYV